MRNTTMYAIIAGMAILLFRCYYVSSSTGSILETPSSKEYVDSLLLENSKRDLYIKALQQKVLDITAKIEIDSLEHIKELERYDKMSREEKVAVIEGNVGSVVADRKMVCLDSTQVDSVNKAFMKLELSERKIVKQWDIINAQSRSIEIYKEKGSSYTAIIDTLIVENFNVRSENIKLRDTVKKSIKKTRRNRIIAFGAGAFAVMQSAILYLAVNK